MCGPHWWEASERSQYSGIPPVSLIAEQLDTVIPRDVRFSPSEIARMLRDADPRWKRSDKLGLILPRVLREANTRAGYPAEPHPDDPRYFGSRRPPFFFTGRRWIKTGAWSIAELFQGDTP
jgi:hypothetical protein